MPGKKKTVVKPERERGKNGGREEGREGSAGVIDGERKEERTHRLSAAPRHVTPTPIQSPSGLPAAGSSVSPHRK